MDRKFIIFVVFAIAVRSSVESCRVKDDFENEFARISAAFMKDSFLNQTEIVADLYIAQCALEVATSKVTSAIDGVFTEITDSLIEVSVLLKGESIADLQASESAKARSISEFTIASIVVFNALLATQPNASTEIAAAREEIIIATPILFDNLYKEIDAALNQSTSCLKTLEDIEALKEEESFAIKSAIQIIFDVIRNNQTFEAELDSQLTTVEQKSLVDIERINIAVFNGNKVLAKAFCEDDGVSDNDFFAVRSYEGKALAACVDLVEDIFTAALLAASANYEK